MISPQISKHLHGFTIHFPSLSIIRHLPLAQDTTLHIYPSAEEKILDLDPLSNLFFRPSFDNEYSSSLATIISPALEQPFPELLPLFLFYALCSRINVLAKIAIPIPRS